MAGHSLPWKLSAKTLEDLHHIFPFVGHCQALASFHSMTQLSYETLDILDVP